MSSYQAEDQNDRILKKLECPLCFEYCTSTIFMCKNGHNVCETCQKSIQFCGICRQEKPTSRNRFAEDLSESVLRPCRYVDQGCQDKFCLRDLEEHMLSCHFGYPCQIHADAKCYWNGSIDNLKAHVLKEHKGRYRECPADKKPISWQFNLSKTYETVALFGCDDHLFWCTMTYDSEQQIFSGSVRFIGRDSDARKYRCRFEFEKDDKKLNYACNVMTLHQDVTRKDKEILRGMIVSTFADNNYLKCDVFIFKN